MATAIQWETDIEKALERAGKEGKQVLLDFFNPNWIGCKQMGAVTYPDEDVVRFVEKYFVPLQLLFDVKPYANDFNIKWTPTIITLDHDGKEHHRTLGFMNPDEFVASLALALGKVYFDADQFGDAESMFEKILTENAKSDSAPEGVFMLGVTKYKKTQDPKALRLAYEKLMVDYPSSEWTQRAKPYSLIE